MTTREGYSHQFEAALQVAARAHHEQARKGNRLPYIVHPVHVSVILLRHGFSTDVAIAGLLHDVVEDQRYELVEIQDQFGVQVAEIVETLTEQKRDERGRKRPWEVRKCEALEQIRRASREAVAVKAADTLHNAYSFIEDLRREGSQLWHHFNRGPQPQLEYYGEVLRVTEERLGDHPLTAELADAVRELAQVVDETSPKDEKLTP